MRILLLTYFFPPDREVGALRPAKLVRALGQRGHEVVTVAAGTGPSTEDGVVRRVRPFRSPRELYLAWKRSGTKVRNPSADLPSTTMATGPAVATAASRWKRYLFAALWLPDDRQGFVPPAVHEAVRLHRKGPFDLLYTSAPPFSTHLAGLLVHRLTRLPWVAEYRDPWLDTERKSAAFRSALTDRLEAWLEVRCLSDAVEVVAVTESTGRRLSERRAALGHSPVIVALNGIDAVMPPRRPREGPLRVLYLGNLYLGRDPQPFLSALSQLLDSAELPREGIVVDFVGDCRTFRGKPVAEIAAELGLEDIVRFRDHIPHQEAAQLLREADVLLLLAQEQPAQVPNKLFEYLGAGKLVLAFADAEGETAAMLRRVGGHVVVTERDYGREAELIAGAFSRCRSELETDEAQLRAWSTEAQLTGLITALEHRLGCFPNHSRGGEPIDAHENPEFV